MSGVLVNEVLRFKNKRRHRRPRDVSRCCVRSGNTRCVLCKAAGGQPSIRRAGPAKSCRSAIISPVRLLTVRAFLSSTEDSDSAAVTRSRTPCQRRGATAGCRLGRLATTDLAPTIAAPASHPAATSPDATSHTEPTGHTRGHRPTARTPAGLGRNLAPAPNWPTPDPRLPAPWTLTAQRFFAYHTPGCHRIPGPEVDFTCGGRERACR
jgi:hypothetical protein